MEDPGTGHWTGFFPDIGAGDSYRYYIDGPDGADSKRDPRARELDFTAPPDSQCIVTDAGSYPWHDAEFRAPAFNDLVVYQFHVGRFYARDSDGGDGRVGRVAKLLDAVQRVEYMAGLGVNAIQPLPLVEFDTPHSMGYNGTDIFSPEQQYCVADGDLPAYLPIVNGLLERRGASPIGLQDLRGQVNQLKAFVDVCHLYGIAVIADVVLNHGGGFNDDSHSIYDFELAISLGTNLYFTNQGWAGGLVFAFGQPGVEAFLIDNCKMWLEEYHADGLRFDEVTVIDQYKGWFFAQDLTATLRYAHPGAVLIAEYWGISLGGPSSGLPTEWASTSGTRTRCVTGSGAFSDRPQAVLAPRSTWGNSPPAFNVPGAFRKPGRRTTAARTRISYTTGTAMTTANPESPNSPAGTTRDPGTRAAARAWPTAFCSPRPACRCCSWAKNSCRTRCGTMTPTTPRISSGGTERRAPTRP